MIVEQLGLDEQEIAQRKAIFEISEEDVNLLQASQHLLAPLQPALVDCFYQHILSFQEARNILAQSDIHIDHLKSLQLHYFQSQTSGCYDFSYYCNHLKIGLIHERVGIKMKWYLGAYRKYLAELFHQMKASLQDDSERLNSLLCAISKVVALDMGLTIDAYIFSNRQTILELEQRQENLIQGIDGFIWEFDVIQHQYRYVSSKAEVMLGYSPTQWLDNPDFQQHIVIPENRQDTLAAFLDAIAQGRNFSIEYRVKAADGRLVWVSERITAEKNSHGKVVLLRGLMLDIDELKRHEEQLSYLATYDELTGLPNRNLFNSHLHITLADAKRHGNKLAILFLDLDSFKDINDSLGHNAGDQLLKTIGHRLRNHSLRESDFVARFGGDEFCIILEIKTDEFLPEHVAERCLRELNKPCVIDASSIYPRASIGIALFPDDGNTPESLMQRADNAMYAAKSSGINRYAFYNPHMTALAERKLSLENDLRKAVETGNFELLYQPQVSLVSGKMVGVEALIRWHDPIRGMVPPDEFIPVAEKIGLISAIGEWVLQTACQQFFEWRKASVPIDHVAVNISGSHFRTGKLPETIINVIQVSGIRAEELKIEITEGVMQTGEDTISCFRKLNQIGIKIAIDDFGTGYSCLSSLTQLPISCLKIDKAFVQDVLNNTNNSAIVATILSMSRILKFTVVAEGVETLEQLNYLQAVGCDLVQGYFFSKPVNAERIKELAASGFLPVSATQDVNK